MSDYIKREDVLSMVRNGQLLTLNEKWLLQLINALPAADVVERKKGEWEKGIHAVECSACSEKFYFPDDVWVEDFDICEDIGWKYCPNCGADMRKDGDT